MVMLDKSCLEQLLACNVFLIRKKLDEVVKDITKLISDGKELLAKYKAYDRSVLETTNFHYWPNGFHKGIFLAPDRNSNKTIYFGINRENGVAEARVVSKDIRPLVDQKFSYIPIIINELVDDKIKEEEQIRIIKELSINNTVKWSVFNSFAYDVWGNECMQLLDDIDRDKSWFPKYPYSLANNPDKDFIELFSKQIASLESRLNRYTSSKKVSLTWLRIKNKFSGVKNWAINIVKKIVENWIISLIGTFVGGIVFWDKIKQAVFWLLSFVHNR